MLLIIDANCAAKTLCNDPSADFAPVYRALINGVARITIGGTKQKEEYQRLNSVWRFIRTLDQAGKAHLVRDSDVDTEQARLEENAPLLSDDPHIVALAIVSGSRILCSHDQALHKDFSNTSIIKPKGRVYQDASHSHLLSKKPAAKKR